MSIIKLQLLRLLLWLFPYRVTLMFSKYPQSNWAYFKKIGYKGSSYRLLFRLNDKYYVVWIY
jgi:hypothetical protein